MKTVIIIPARGGSKGIPRKNLRPIAGKPLIFYVINTCKNAQGVSDVIVTTDDDEIALFSERFGAKVIMRDPTLAFDMVTLDPVIVDAAKKSIDITGYTPDILITVQPTSPLISTGDIEKCLNIFKNNEHTETVLSVVDDRHLCWTMHNGKALPAYKERVNRQLLKPNFRETGAIIACRSALLDTGTRIGKSVSLLELPQERSFDIDNTSDLHLCESILNTKKIVFAVIGYPEVGLGHAYRAVLLANEFVKHQIIFVCEERSELAKNYISSQNYDVVVSKNSKLADTIIELQPDLVINDILDTEIGYVKTLKKYVAAVVNFEDLGSGIEEADLVFNALYSNIFPYSHIKVGPEYFCLRNEFIFAPKNRAEEVVKTLLISFGGVDEGNLTYRVANLLKNWAHENKIKLLVVTGPGYQHIATLAELQEGTSRNILEIVSRTSRISDYMCQADIAITSGGRTVFEMAALRLPTVVICQNQRETTHTFASSENGIVNLGNREILSDTDIFKHITLICSNVNIRLAMIAKMKRLNLTHGKKRVRELIENLLYRE